MAFKIDESRIRELAQIEADSNCPIGAGGHISLESVPGPSMASKSPDRVMQPNQDDLVKRLIIFR